MNKLLKNFYKKFIEECIEVLEFIDRFDVSLNKSVGDIVFDYLIENFIMMYEVGLGVVLDFLIDDVLYYILMVIEEFLVIVGVVYVVKIIYCNGGFKIDEINCVMIG